MHKYNMSEACCNINVVTLQLVSVGKSGGCTLMGKTHRRHRLVVTPVTSSLRGTHPPVSSTAVIRGSIESERQCATAVASHFYACIVQCQCSDRQFVPSVG